MADIQIAALFSTSAGAEAAREALAGLNVDGESVMVLVASDAAAAGTVPVSPLEIWAALKEADIPDDDAHVFAEAIDRGHAVLVAVVTEPERTAALGVVRAAGPLNLDDSAAAWRADGWSGIYLGQSAWLAARDADGFAAGSEGMVNGLIAGDYGAVGTPLRASVDTDITRGEDDLAEDPDAAAAAGDIRIYA